MMMKGGDFKLLLRTCEGKLRSDRPLEATLEAPSGFGIGVYTLSGRVVIATLAGKTNCYFFPFGSLSVMGGSHHPHLPFG
jgi:hypothetical protein